MKPATTEKILGIARRAGILRPRDLDAYRIPRRYVSRLYCQGHLRRVGRGLYVAADAEVSAQHSLAQAAKWVPQGVGCLLTALQFHAIGTQAPFEVWLAVDRRAARPRINYPPLRILRFSGKALSEGIEEQHIEGVLVKVYNPAKTVADCFKYRNKIGLDVALEALRECVRERKATMDELWHYAQICRVEKVMKPYLEAVV